MLNMFKKADKIMSAGTVQENKWHDITEGMSVKFYSISESDGVKFFNIDVKLENGDIKNVASVNKTKAKDKDEVFENARFQMKKKMYDIADKLYWE